MTRSAAALALAAVMVLGGCGSDSDPDSKSAEPASSSSTTAEAGPGSFAATTDTGAVITVDVPVEATAPDLAKLETYRTAAGAEPPTYAVAEIDNSAGSDDLLLLDVTAELVDADGQQMTLAHVAAPEGYFETQLSDALSGKQSDAAQAWYSAFYDSQRLVPGAKTTIILVGTTAAADPATTSRVFVIPEEYGDTVEAVRQ